MVNNLSIIIHALHMCMLTLLSVDEIFPPKCINWFTNFRDFPFNEEMIPSWLKHTNSVLSEFPQRAMLLATCSRLCCRDSALTGVFARNARSSVWSACNSFCGIFSASCFFLVWSHFLSLDLLMFMVPNLRRLWIKIVPIYFLTRFLQQCPRN